MSSIVDSITRWTLERAARGAVEAVKKLREVCEKTPLATVTDMHNLDSSLGTLRTFYRSLRD